MKIRVLHFGLGPIGIAIARQVANHKTFKIAGGIDIDPSKSGRDISDVIGLGAALGAKVWSDVDGALRATKPDIVVLCTSSTLRKVAPQIETVLKAGVAVVSTTEELAYPTAGNMPLLRHIDSLAKRWKVAVLGTGVNPGFVMDTLPITLTGVCERVDAIRIDRIQDARTRRLPFQQKIGAGLTLRDFRHRVAQGSVRHVGLAESIQMIGDALGWKIDRISDRVRPKIADRRLASKYLHVEAGNVCGLIQDGIGYVGSKPLIRLHMEAYLGAAESYDAVRISGSPALHLKMLGGTHGDIATASVIINSIPKILAASPGYKTMRDLPVPSFFRGI